MPEETSVENNPKRARQVKTFATVPFAQLEHARHRLGLPIDAFSEALGLTKGAYFAWKNAGKASKTASIAAEGLMRRQSRESTHYTLLKHHHSSVDVIALSTDEPDHVTIKGQKYLLLPIKE